MEVLPKINIEPPGPEAKKALEKEKECFSPRWSVRRYLPFVPAEGEGAVVKDVDGNFYFAWRISPYSTPTLYCNLFAHPSCLAT